MKGQTKPVVFAVLLIAALTIMFFVALGFLYPPLAIERFHVGTVGFFIYLSLCSLSGFLVSLKSPGKTIILCSIGIPALFVISILLFLFIAPDLIYLPVYGNGIYNESVRYSAFAMIAFPFSCIVVFALTILAYQIKQNYFSIQPPERSSEIWKSKDHSA
jgi:hypothetical protein